MNKIHSFVQLCTTILVVNTLCLSYNIEMVKGQQGQYGENKGIIAEILKSEEKTHT